MKRDTDLLNNEAWHKIVASQNTVSLQNVREGEKERAGGEEEKREGMAKEREGSKQA